MQQDLPSKKARLNIQISSELKSKLFQVSALQGKRVSVLVRESIEEKIKQTEKRMFEQEMKQAYLDLAQENLQISKDFEHIDAENL